MKKQMAFTLAEVLITLTIIGVIAAITIPNLMQKWRKHEVEVRLKDAYSTINQAIRMAEITSNTDSDEWNYTSATAINEYLIPMFKNAIHCGGSRGNVYQGKPCVGLSFTGEGYTNCLDINGNTTLLTYNCSKAIILSNGSSICFALNSAYKYVSLIVDIDGPSRGPEQAGYDIFELYMLNKSSDLKLKNPRFGMYDYGAWAGSSNPSYQIAKQNCITKTPKNGYSLSSLCFAYIMKNGWKIPDDYPVKKW